MTTPLTTTRDVLAAIDARERIPSWLKVALGELGAGEIPGINHNPRIIEYHATTRLAAKQDEVPWCSSFVSWCMLQAGYPSTRSAWARSWLGYGQPSEEIGSIVVLKRGDGGHVGFRVGMGANDTVWLLGGNQSNTVSVARYPVARIMGSRAPVEKRHATE